MLLGQSVSATRSRPCSARRTLVNIDHVEMRTYATVSTPHPSCTDLDAFVTPPPLPSVRTYYMDGPERVNHKIWQIRHLWDMHKNQPICINFENKHRKIIPETWFVHVS